MKKRRSKIPLKVELELEKPMESLEHLLDSVFWKAPSLTKETLEFLKHLRDWSRTDFPYRADEWDNYRTRAGMSQGKYHNMLKRLRKAGMIKKEYNKSTKKHEIHLSDKFSTYLSRMSRLWDEFCIR